ncbi:MAG: DNA polymerase clamp loader subunit A [Flavobacteriaceae bacterium]|nr:DNA polymerase clamp loader subunit A [Flavobacteriaceae bacterium]
MKLKLSDWLNSINFGKNDLIENIDNYSPFIINKAMSGYIDTLFFANELNRFHFLDKDIQYKYYLKVIKKKRRYAPWLKSTKDDNISAIKEYYNYSDKKAKAVLDLLSIDHLSEIKKSLYKGGT